VEAIKDSTEKLMGVSQSFSQRLYEQASQAASAPSGSDGSGGGSDDAGAGSDDEVVDAEIVDEQ
jgi:molecular chaperone DnaK